MVTKGQPDTPSLLASRAVPLVVAPVSAVAMLWLGLPGIVLPWLALVAHGASIRRPELTGPRKDGRPTVGSDREQRQIDAYGHAVDLRDACLSPTTLAPGWPVLGTWVAAVLVGVGAWLLPQGWDMTRWVNAVLAAQMVAAVAHAGRVRDRAEPSPGTRVDSLPGLLMASPVRSVLHILGGGVAGAGLVVAGLTVAGLPLWSQSRARLLTLTLPILGTPLPLPDVVLDHLLILPPTPAWQWLALGVALGMLGGIAGPWRDRALAHWRQVVQARAEWADRWPVVKADPAPRLVDHVELDTPQGTVLVETFTCSAAYPAEKVLAAAPQLKPTLGDDQVRLALLPQPQTDPKTQQPIPGTSSTLGFRAIRWPGGPIDITEPDADPRLVALALESAMAWAAESTGWTRMLLLDATPLAGTRPEEAGPVVAGKDDTPTPHPHVEPARQAWAVQWTSPIGMEMVQVRLNLAGPMAGSLGCDVLVDHRANGGRLRASGLMYAGSLLQGPGVLGASRLPAPLPSGIDDLAEHLENLSIEDWWVGVWAAVLGSEANPPTPKHNVRRTVTLPGGAEIVTQPFVVRQGQEPSSFFGTERKLTSAMDSMGFVAVTGFPDGSAKRPGERHGMAFQVHYSRSAVPGITALAPCPPVSALPLVAGRVNGAFRAAKLAQPETYAARCLTEPASQGHIWEATVRLHDGVTLADLRARQKQVAIALGVPWLRIVEHGNDCRIVAGADPQAARMGERERAETAAWDWEQVWRDARCTGVDGALPTLLSIRRLPSNQAVSELVFKVPDGLDAPRLKAAKGKIATASENGFVDITPGAEPSTVRLLAARADPMPEMAPFRFDTGPGPGRIVFADGIDGEPVDMDVTEIAHLMMTGTSGGGKTTAAQTLLMSALDGGAEAVVIDVQKSCADFRFAEPWTVRMAGDLAEAAATMGAVYAEGQRRLALNAEHGVARVDLLPENIRPPELFVLVDEFFGLISSPERPSSKPEANPDMEATRLETMAAYNAKARIAYLTGRIAAETRSAGVHLFLMTQALTSKMRLPASIADLKLNSNRILLGKANHGERTSALRQPESAPDPGEVVPVGRAVYEPVVGGEARVVQFWYASTAEYTRWLTDNVDPVTDDERLDIEPYRLDPTEGAAFVVTDEDDDQGTVEISDEPTVRAEAAEETDAEPEELDLLDGLDLPELVEDDAVDWSAVVGMQDGPDEPLPVPPHEEPEACETLVVETGAPDPADEAQIDYPVEKSQPGPDESDDERGPEDLALDDPDTPGPDEDPDLDDDEFGLPPKPNARNREPEGTADDEAFGVLAEPPKDMPPPPVPGPLSPMNNPLAGLRCR